MGKRKPKAEVVEWTTRIDVTYSTVITVLATTEEEARAKIKSGEWETDRTDGVVDFDDPEKVERSE
jgi:hypothetical protein